MNIVRRLLIFIAILIAIPLIVALFLKKEYTVAREITIKKPRQQVFDYIKMLRNGEHYNKWVMMDPSATKTYKGTDGTVGFISAWESDLQDVGKGEQKIVTINEGKSIGVEITFDKPFEGKAKITNSTTAITDSQTKVTTVISSRMSYPTNLIPLFLRMDQKLGNDMDTTLMNLKTTLEGL